MGEHFTVFAIQAPTAQSFAPVPGLEMLAPNPLMAVFRAEDLKVTV